MKKIALLAVFATLLVTSMLFSAPVSAEVDHWGTKDECVAAVTAPYYFPTIKNPKKLVDGKVKRGLPTPSCIKMDLPDRLGGKGWVRIGADREIFFDEKTGEADNLAECSNHIYEIVALPAPKGKKGDKGDPGQNGQDGAKGAKGDPGPAGKDWAGPSAPDPLARTTTPPPPPPSGFCSRHPVQCWVYGTVSAALIVGGVTYLLSKAGGDGDVNVTTSSTTTEEVNESTDTGGGGTSTGGGTQPSGGSEPSTGGGEAPGGGGGGQGPGGETGTAE